MLWSVALTYASVPVGLTEKLACAAVEAPQTPSATTVGSPLNSRRSASKDCASNVSSRTNSKYPGAAYAPLKSDEMSCFVTEEFSEPTYTPRLLRSEPPEDQYRK